MVVESSDRPWERKCCKPWEDFKLCMAGRVLILNGVEKLLCCLLDLNYVVVCLSELL